MFLDHTAPPCLLNVIMYKYCDMLIVGNCVVFDSKITSNLFVFHTKMKKDFMVVKIMILLVYISIHKFATKKRQPKLSLGYCI